MKRKTFSNDFKAKVAIDAVKGDITISELASEDSVHPTQINRWKKQLLTSASGLFSGRADDFAKSVAELMKANEGS